MKKNIIYLSIIAVAAIFVYTSCKRDVSYIATYDTGNSSTAYIRVVQASPSFRALYSQPDSFNVYVNTTKINGGILSYGSIFPAAGELYAAVPAGKQPIRLSLKGVVNTDSLTVATFTKTLVAGKYYSFIMTDSIMSASKDSTQIFVTDTYAQPLQGYYSLRFVHAVVNDTAGLKVDVFSARRNGNIFTGIKSDSVTTFLGLPYNPSVNDTLYVRRSGTANNLTKAYVFGPVNQRVYTIVYMGDTKATTGTKVKALGLYTNQ
ncbi:DUF4397 domain-containing protein [Chitinophagaceae bacterium LWZ2-11]